MNRENDIAGSRLKRITNRISKNIAWYESIGNDPNDGKVARILKKTGKTLVSAALIGGTAAGLVAGGAAFGLCLAAPVSGGIVSYAGRNALNSAMFGGAINALPPGLKGLLSASLMASGGASSLAVGALGYGASKLSGLASKKFFSEEATIQKRKELGEESVDLDNLEKLENEYEQIAKEAARNRMWRRAISTATALTVSVGFLAWTGAEIEAEELKGTEEQSKEQETTEEEKAAEAEAKRELKKEKLEQERLEDIAKHNAEAKMLEDATVHRGEGVEHAFIRQIENNPKSFGFDGDLNDQKAVHAFAQHEAHVIAIKTGYVDSATGQEVRVAEADKVAYQVRKEGEDFFVDEKVYDEIQETHFNEEDFKGEPDKEYEYLHPEEKESVSETSPVSSVNNAEYMAKKQMEKEETERTEAQNKARETIEQEREETEKMRLKAKAIEREWKENEATANVREMEKQREAELVRDGILKEPESDTAETVTANSLPDEHTIADRAEFYKENPFHLSGEQLQKTYDVHEKNIEFLYPENTRDWSQVSQFKIKDILKNESYRGEHEAGSMVSYLYKLREKAELKPQGGIFRKEENVGHYVARALQKIEQLGRLDEVILK